MYQINNLKIEPKVVLKPANLEYPVEWETCVNGQWQIIHLKEHPKPQISPLLAPCMGLFVLWVFTALYAFALRRRARIAEGKYKLLKGIRSC